MNHYGGHRGVKTILGAGMSQVLQRRTEKPGAIVTWVRIPSAARDFSPYSQLSMQTLWRCPYSPRVRARASTSVRTLKIPNTGNHIALFGDRKTLHTLIGMGSAALGTAMLYPGKATWISRMGQRISTKIIIIMSDMIVSILGINWMFALFCWCVCMCACVRMFEGTLKEYHWWERLRFESGMTSQ